MPTTPAGTAYTVFTATLPTHGECNWAVANAHAGDTNIKTVLYAHGSGGAANQFATLTAWTGLRNWLIDNGWAWIEGDGGGPTSWGNDASQAAYPAYLDYVDNILSIGDVVLLGRSMGGLVTAWMYAQSALKTRFAGWINNSGVSTLFTGSTTDPAQVTWPTGKYFGSAVFDAYGVGGYTALQAAAADHAPESWPASVWAGKKILCCYGNADTTVPWYPRGAKALRDIWAGQPATDLVSVRPGGDHSGTNGSYLDVTAMTDFLLSVTGGTPPTPTVPTFFRVAATPYMVVDVVGVRSRYAFSPKPMGVPPA